MNRQQLIAIQRLVESFFIKSGVNIALHTILEDSSYADFSQKLEDGLTKQLLYFSTIQKINQLTGVQKAHKELQEPDILLTVQKLWPNIEQFIPSDEFKNYGLSAAKVGGQLAHNLVEPDGEYKVKLATRQFVEDKVPALISFIEKTTQSWIARTVQQGLYDGVSHVEIAKLLRDDAHRHAKSRSRAIAEQQAALFANRAIHDVYKSSGIATKKLVSSRDEQSCKICSVDKQAGVIGINDTFPSGVQHPPMHNGCRCFTVPGEYGQL